MTTRRRIFLAHAREDKTQVRKLYADLKAHSLDPWLDELDLVPGQIWKEAIPKAIRQAGVFVACLSSRSVLKVGYVQNEFRLALSAFGERPPGSIYLIPVRLDECDVPDLQIPDRGLSLRDIQWVDLWQQGGFDRLVHAINDAQGAGESQPKAVTLLRDVEEPWCPELVIVPPGKFKMGSTLLERRWAMGQRFTWQWADWEKPQHEVTIPEPFAVGKYELTRGQFAMFAEATTLVISGGLSADWCVPGFEQTDLHPVVCVSWVDAKAYIEWLGKETGQPYRLLSEAEWEYACRAGTTTRYWWGDDEPTPERTNFGGNVGRTTEVGSYPANPWGLYDMHGNTWEWVEDCWNESYQGAPSDGSAWMSGDCSRRVLRGGSWGKRSGGVRSANRSRLDAAVGNYSTGFRVARKLG